MTTLYIRDSQGIYLTSVDLDANGAMPQNSTTTVPPTLTGTQVAEWVNNKWEVLAERPPIPQSTAAQIAQIKASQWLAIKAKRDTLSDTGGYLVGTKWFHSDGKSKTQQLGLVLLGASVPAVPWKTMDGTFVAMSPTLAGQIFQAAVAMDMSLFSVAKQHKDAMEASATPDTYDYSTGWPTVFTP